MRGQLFAPKLKFDLIQYWVRPKPKPMNKSPYKRGIDPFEQAHGKSPRVFMKFLKFLEIKLSGREVGQLFVDVEFP